MQAVIKISRDKNEFFKNRFNSVSNNDFVNNSHDTLWTGIKRHLH